MHKQGAISRITISIPSALLEALDGIVTEKHYRNRSQAVAEMIHSSLVDHQKTHENAVMVGTITLFYDRTSRDIKNKLDDLQFKHIDEVISSLHIHLANDRVIEVILVQGPALRLQNICHDMMSLKGVITGNLQLMAAIIPPLHPLSNVQATTPIPTDTDAP